MLSDFIIIIFFKYDALLLVYSVGLYGLPKRNGKLKDISRFDAAFFGVHSKQANTMDPQLRLMMEVAYEAIVDGGEGLNEGCWLERNHEKKNALESLVEEVVTSAATSCPGSPVMVPALDFSLGLVLESTNVE